MSLNPRQTVFVAEYLKRKHGTKAAIAAGYSPRSAYSTACELLKNPEVEAEIRRQLERILDVSVDKVRQEIASIAFADMRDAAVWGVGMVKIGFDADGKRLAPADIMDAVMVMEVPEAFVTPLNSEDLPAHIAAAVAEVSLGKEGFKIKMHPKLSALDMLSKMLGYYAPEKHELTGPGGAPIAAEVEVSPAEAYQKMIGGAG